MSLGLTQLGAIMPTLGRDRALQLLPFINEAMAEREINSPPRMAAFLAQIAHESVQLTIFEELPHRKPISWCGLCQRRKHGHDAGVQYEGRADLGNTHDGDGVRYKGRGPIQLTGRANYETFGTALGLDLVNHPEEAMKPEVAFRVATLFWQKNGLNELADRGDFSTITKRINGGLNGYADRVRYHARALTVLAPAASETP